MADDAQTKVPDNQKLIPDRGISCACHIMAPCSQCQRRAKSEIPLLAGIHIEVNAAMAADTAIFSYRSRGRLRDAFPRRVVCGSLERLKLAMAEIERGEPAEWYHVTRDLDA